MAFSVLPPPDGGFSVFVLSPPDGGSVFPPDGGVSGVVSFFLTYYKVIVVFLVTTSFPFYTLEITNPGVFVLSLYFTLIVNPAKSALAAASVLQHSHLFTFYHISCSVFITLFCWSCICCS